MQIINSFFSWLSGTYRKLGCLGKIIFGSITLLVICCICSVPISILNPNTSAPITSEEISTSIPDQNENPTETPQPTSPPSPTETLEPHTALKVEIERVLGSGNRDVPRLTALNFDDPEKGAIFVNWAINDNLTENLIKFGAKSDATDILEAIAQSEIDYTYIILSGSFPLVDQFGNSEVKNVVNLTFYKETVERINWENFLSDNIYSIADEAFIWVTFQDK